MSATLTLELMHVPITQRCVTGDCESPLNMFSCQISIKVGIDQCVGDRGPLL